MQEARWTFLAVLGLLSVGCTASELKLGIPVGEWHGRGSFVYEFWGADDEAFVTEFSGSESQELRGARRDLLISNLRRHRAEEETRRNQQIHEWERELLEAEHALERRAR